MTCLAIKRFNPIVTELFINGRTFQKECKNLIEKLQKISAL